MTTLLDEVLESGDVIEMRLGDDVITALVLLAAETAIVIDPLTGDMPFVLQPDELVEYRRYVPS